MSHILLIDDDSAICDVMGIVVTDLGHTLSIISSFNDLKKKRKLSVDLILLDGTIGQHTGKEINKYLRKDLSLQETPIIVFSADDKIEEMAEEIKAQGVLKKPFDMTQLEEIIMTHICE